MLGTTFYFSTTRNFVAAFGTLFNNINIERLDSSGNLVKTIKVPLGYGPQQYWMAKLNENHSDPDVKITAPRISFQIDEMQYDPQRQKNPIRANRYIDQTNPDIQYKQFQSVPYNYSVSMSVYAQNMDDGLQIVEQILPYFSPDFNLTVIEIPSINLSQDVPVILQNVSFEDNYEGGYDDGDRTLIWNFNFIAHANIFPPIGDADVIKKVVANIHDTNQLKQYQEIINEVNPITADEDDAWTVAKTVTDDP